MINLFNNLNSVQAVKIRDRNNTYYTMFIEAKKSVTLEGYQITKDIINKINLGNLVDLSNTILPVKQSSLVIDPIKINDVSKIENSETTEVNENSETTEVSENKLEELNNINSEDSGIFVCEICGNEYASARGLEMHKSRSHK